MAVILQHACSIWDVYSTTAALEAPCTPLSLVAFTHMTIIWAALN